MKIKAGDSIKFRAFHFRVGWRTATRKVKGIDPWGRPMVGMFGWSEFIIQPEEIIAVNGKSALAA